MASTGTRTSSTTGSTEGITQTTTYLLAGDIGGTNSRLRLYASAHDQSDPLVDKDYRNQVALTDKNAGAFERLILHPFLEHCSTELKSKGLTPIDESEIIAVLACAGPVKNNEATLTNLGITIDGNAIESNLHCQHQGTHASTVKRALIINDFVAQGYGCLTLDSTEIMELTPGSLEMIDPTGPKVCVGAGTGLGECFLTPNGSGYTCFPSEGGHVEYNPRSSLEIDLRSFLMAETESDTRISVERVVSGTGLANVYRFLSTECPDLVDKVDKKIHDDFLSAGDQQGRVVSEGAKAGNEICAMAMDIMISAYGSEVGSAALKWIPTGGLYVTGGITPKNIDRIKGSTSEFMKAYRDKGRASVVLDKVPLFAVISMVDDLGVRGAYYVCITEYDKTKKSD